MALEVNDAEIPDFGLILLRTGERSSIMARKVKAIREIKLDKTDPGKKLEKDELCTVEELVENWIILRKQDGSSCMVDLMDFERGFEAAEDLPGAISSDL